MLGFNKCYEGRKQRKLPDVENCAYGLTWKQFI